MRRDSLDPEFQGEGMADSRCRKGHAQVTRYTGAKRRDGRVLIHQNEPASKSEREFLKKPLGFVIEDHELVLRVGTKPNRRFRDRKS